MRIGVVVPSLSRLAGGLHHSVRLLCQHLNNREGLRLTVFGLEDAFTAEDLSHWSPIKPCVFSIKGPPSFGYAEGLARTLLQSDLDLIHLHGGLWRYPALANLFWKWKTKKPYVVSPRGMLDPWAVQNARLKKFFVRKLFADRHLHRAACLHSLCDAEASALRAYGLRNAICRIPNGVELPTSKKKTTEAPWSRYLGNDRKVLLYLGRIHPKKGLINLIEGFSLAREQGGRASKEWSLVIAGWDQGHHEKVLKALVRDRGLDDTVLFTGPLFGESKAAAYVHAEAFALASFSEGLPMTILEAWSYELPVVMTEECHLNEGFLAGAALEVTPDKESIARGLADLFSMSEDDRKSMGRKGRRLVEMHFTWENVASQLYDVYRWVLEGGSPPDTVVRC